MDKERTDELREEAEEEFDSIDMDEFWEGQSESVREQLEKNRKARAKSLEKSLGNFYL